MKKVILFCCLALLFAISSPVFAHPGNTDSNGCHTCKTNCTEKWGIPYGFYHRHNPVRPCFEPTIQSPIATKKPLPTATQKPLPTATKIIVPTSTPIRLPTATRIILSTATPIPTRVPTVLPTTTNIPTPQKTVSPTMTPTLMPTEIISVTTSESPTPTITIPNTLAPQPIKVETAKTDLRWRTHWWNFSPLTTLFGTMFGWK